MSYTNNILDANLEILSSQTVQLDVTNKTNDVITIIMDSSSFTDSSRASCKFVIGESRAIDSQRSQPVQIVPPKGEIRKNIIR